MGTRARATLVCCVVLLLAQTARAGTRDLERHDADRLLRWPNAGWLALGGGAALMVHPWDDDGVEHLAGSAVLERTAPVTNALLEGYAALPVTALTWTAGALAGNEGLEGTGSLLCRALLYVQLTVGPVKVLAGRERPDRSNSRAFPSGHAANAFALARAAHRRCGPWVGVPAYLGAALTAAGRVHSRKHFPSDVVMGGCIGLVIGNSVALEEQGGGQSRLNLELGTRSGRVAWRF